LERLLDAAERLIASLDAMDGADRDLEADELDLGEEDRADFEPSLGAPESRVSQAFWATGGLDDYELQDEDATDNPDDAGRYCLTVATRRANRAARQEAVRLLDSVLSKPADARREAVR